MSDRLDLRDRDRLFAGIDGVRFDVAVIGGGITGAGVARDAAMRGLSVALIEAEDFASGTSSRSSKMIHGGLRYLPMGDIALVREAASERKAVQAIAPHLARETPFVIPARNAGAVAKLRAGLWTFEKLGGVPKSRKHEVWSQAELKDREPAIAAGELAGAVVYPEYLTDDARLTLANVRSAAAHGATCLNHARVAAIITEGGIAAGLEVVDDAGRRVRLFAKAIVNAAGPWVDAVRSLEDAGAPPRLQLSKGVHIVVDRERLPVSRTVIMPAADRRSVFAVPKGRATYIGTTDAFYPDADLWPRIDRADVDYLIEAAMRCFATAPLRMADITSAWSGVRPLVAEAGKSASEVSRKDEVWVGPAGVISIGGGKLTAYRRMAERVVDRIEDALGRKASACRTAEAPLPGGEVDVAAARALLARGGMAPEAADRLVSLYGAEAAAVAGDGGDIAAEVRHAVLAEGALTLDDYWVRRSARAWFAARGGIADLAPTAAAMAPLLGWSAAERDRQVAACRAIHDRNMAFAPEGALA
ncbi:MAG TPA: glycerol-3-phosphate dehydrogenase/oxidase [Caulobacteraceae bacterium]|nr:glycerol-3-phosphate dehydrogenase/oxidase [Caulobacteraceae bacterium]